jgi:tRNA isopentenyl-2-thiomethyl-A-37 hydroxylase MiaE
MVSVIMQNYTYSWERGSLSHFPQIKDLKRQQPVTIKKITYIMFAEKGITVNIKTYENLKFFDYLNGITNIKAC